MAKQTLSDAKSSSEHDIPEIDEKPAPIGNGGQTEKYTWSQTLSETQICIPVSLEMRGKDCSVKILPKRLLVSTAGEVVIDGEAPKEVLPSESCWTLETDERTKTRTLTLHLVKKNKMEWWDCAVSGDEAIDTKSIRPENSTLDDLDDETQRTVRKMMVLNIPRGLKLIFRLNKKSTTTSRSLWDGQPVTTSARAAC